jgi:hypothetical protein
MRMTLKNIIIFFLMSLHCHSFAQARALQYSATIAAAQSSINEFVDYSFVHAITFMYSYKEGTK